MSPTLAELPLALRLMAPDAPLGTPDEADWALADREIERHRLETLVHWTTRTRQDIPSALAGKWELRSREAAILTLGQQEELRRAFAILASAGIEAVALKGAFLAFHAYPQLGVRPMGDLDLLMRGKEEALAALSQLRANGYALARGGDGDARIEDIASHQLPVILSPRGTALDLHWKLGHDTDGSLSGTAYWERTIERPLLGITARYPGLEDQAAHLIGHATRQNALLNGPVVLADLACLMRLDAFDTATFVDRLAEHRLERAALPLLDLVSCLWPDIAVPDALALPNRRVRQEGVALVLALFERSALELINGRAMSAVRDSGWLKAKLLPSPQVLAEAGAATRREYWMRLGIERLPSIVQTRRSGSASLQQRFMQWIDRAGDG